MTDAPLILDKECKRCGKRKPTNPDWSRNWNDTWIAGLHAGCLCPDCMTDEEDLEGQINELAGGRMVYTTFDGMSHDEAWDAWIAFTVPLLTEMYRTPEKLRA